MGFFDKVRASFARFMSGRYGADQLSMALVIAALAARGRSRIADTGHIDRGYACFVQMLTELGAQIEREMPCGSTCEKKTPSKKQN